MQSKLVAAKDYHEVALDIPAFVPDQAALQKELDRLRNPYVTWEPGGTAAAGDMVRCSLHSALPRFQKDSIRFVAGSGMYNPTLEALAIGMQAGESRTATLPEGEVTLTVQAVQKRVVPALTDEMAAACKLPGVRTVAGYRRYLLAQQRDKAAAQAAWTLAARIKRTVLDGSAFVLCKACLLYTSWGRAASCWRTWPAPATGRKASGSAPAPARRTCKAGLRNWDCNNPRVSTA